MDGAIAADDETRIVALLREEIETFQKGDFEAWSALWVQDSRVRDISHSQLHGTTIMRGWDEIAPAMANLMRERGVSFGAPYEHLDHNITVNGNTAWLTYRTINEDPLCPTDLCEEIRILEKGRDGRWRFVLMSVATSGGKVRLASAVEVDGDGRVLWTGQEAATRLEDHSVLTVSGGKLVARRPSEGADLRESISRAAQLARTNISLYPGRMSEALTFPVVLGVGDDGENLICLVRLSDGRVFVDLNPAAEIARRLSAGAILFGLSDAQTALVTQIAAGLSLPAAAKRAGISVNTARTHLSRIYDKTGVNAQPALIRLLLSVG